MNRDLAWRYARKILDMLGLSSWGLRFTMKRNLWGLCIYDEQVIEISWFLHDRIPTPEFVDTVLHEAAHAMLPPGESHGPLWMAKCVELGCRPEATKKVPFRKLGPWIATCPKCGVVSDRWARPKQGSRYFCTGCPPKVYLEWRKREG